MRFRSCTVTSSDPADAVAGIKEQLVGFPVKAILFFASYQFTGTPLARMLQDAFPGAVTFGCSSSAEIGNNGLQRRTVTAMAMSDAGLEGLELAVISNITGDPGAVDTALEALEKRLGQPVLDLDFARNFGLVLFDGRSPRFEAAMERLNARTDILMVGGFASDDFSMEKIAVYHNGIEYQDAMVLAVVKPRGVYQLCKTQSACAIGPTFTVTRTDASGYSLYELDHQPAAEMFAKGIGIDVSELSEQHFLDYSFGIMAEGKPFVRAGRSILDNGGLQLFYSVHEGQRLVLHQTGDIIAATASSLEELRQTHGKIEAIIDFDCAHREMLLAIHDTMDEYAALFKGIETAGFATFGETFIGNINQTAVMVVFFAG